MSRSDPMFTDHQPEVNVDRATCEKVPPGVGNAIEIAVLSQPEAYSARVMVKRKTTSTDASSSKRRQPARVASTKTAKIEADTSPVGPAAAPGAAPSTVKPSKKFATWNKHATASPYPDFLRPTPAECTTAYKILHAKHHETVRKVFAQDPQVAPESYDQVMDAITVALLSQATSWSNAKRALASMAKVYTSPFAFDAILDGGEEKLRDALRPGGMQNRKAKMLLQVLRQVKAAHPDWNMNHLFDASDEAAMAELLEFKGMGPKSAYCVLSICLQRRSFAVDTHIYRVTGLWGWRPAKASKELAQAHLDARIPGEMKYDMHYLFIVHGQECPACKHSDGKGRDCDTLREITAALTRED